jgi:superfamily II DNA or RNA helicase
MEKTRVLRDWQIDALKKWEEHNFHGIVEVATAGGKTFYALECIKIWLNRFPNSKVLIIVPTTALLDQWYLALTDDLHIQKEEISAWPEDKKLNARFQIMIVNTARTKAKLVAEKSDKLLVIADECHRYASKENSVALMIDKDAALGLTATAEREYDDGLKDVLIPNLGEIIYTYDIANARTDNVVSKFEISNIEVPFKPSESVEYNKFSRRIAQAMSKGDMDKVARLSILRSQVSRNAESRIPTACLIAEENKGKRIIIFHEEISKANLIFEILNKRRQSVGIYHSQMSVDTRRENLSQFKKGIIEILVCCRALDEGVDIPESEVAIIAAATSSSRQRIQRIGRVIRLHGTKEVAKIYTIYITEKEQEKLRLEEKRLSNIATFKWFEMSVS